MKKSTNDLNLVIIFLLSICIYIRAARVSDILFSAGDQILVFMLHIFIEEGGLYIVLVDSVWPHV